MAYDGAEKETQEEEIIVRGAGPTALAKEHCYE
jgi:hypothetical protein